MTQGEAVLSRLPQVLERIASIQARIDGMSPTPASERAVARSFREELAAAGAVDARPSGCGQRASAAAFDDVVRMAAARSGLSTDLIHAVIRAESDYNPRCTSSAGAMGLMQLMPGTARALGVADPYDPVENVLGGTRYLREQLDRFGDLSLALAAYNAGPGAVQRYGGIPPYHETQAYVRRILADLGRTGGAP